MPKIAQLLVLILLLGTICGSLLANLRKEFTALEELYNKGKLDELAAALLGARPNHDEERALVDYLSAMLKVKRSDAIALLDRSITSYPQTLYGQKSMLERAKIHILERDVASARILLQKITSTSLLERYYWLAVCAEMQNDFASSINHAENYLRLAPQGAYVQETHYLLAEVYLDQKKYQSAITTLNKLKALRGFPSDEQYFHYRLGNAHHLAGNYSEALQNYKTGLELNKYSQVAFQIEDRLFDLRSTYGSRIDLGFLYPYEELDLPVTITETTVSEPPSLPPVVEHTLLKLPARPSGGFYVQAGRFSVEANASSLSFNIRKLNLAANYFEDKNNKTMPWVVVSGPYKTKSEAETARSTLISNNIDCFITQY